eukprot:245154-Rhodomonas_salina.1
MKKHRGALTNSDLMFCMALAWKVAFSPDKCRHAWEKTGLIPFTQRPFWELKQAEGAALSARERIKIGVTKINWNDVTQIATELTEEEIKAFNAMLPAKKKKLASTDFWDQLRGQEELLELHEQRLEESGQAAEQVAVRAEQRIENTTQLRRDAGPLVLELQKC